jgi:high affinity sulfate transporter 1
MTPERGRTDPASGWIGRFAPGLAALLGYDRRDLPHDLRGGLAVAAVGIPSSIAYAGLAGLSPAAGLYASILPLAAYALFGTSRQLMLGPTAAVCALVGAAVAPLAGGDQALHASLAAMLALMTGALCIGAGLLRLGAIADFLSRPILLGFMNGVAINILLGQIPRALGIPVESTAVLAPLAAIADGIGSMHWPTFAVAAGTLALLVAVPRVHPRLPAALVAMIVAAGAVVAFRLEAAGVATVGPVAAGLPAPYWPAVPPETLATLVVEAVGIALVAFSTMTLTARSFADRNRYDVDPDRDFGALGVANLAAALSHGFPVSGSGSRTAALDASGGRTQLAGIVSAVAVAAVLLLLTTPLRFVPIPALAVVLIVTAVSLFEWRALRMIWRIDPREGLLAVVATVGVVLLGVMYGIIVAVMLAVLRFVRLAARPRVDILGRLSGRPGYHSTSRHPEAATTDGLVLFRFNGPVVFFSAPYFKREALAAADAAGPGLKWFVIDLLPVNMIDATGLYAIGDVADRLRARGVVVAAAARQSEWEDWAAERGLTASFDRVRLFPTLRQAVRVFREESRASTGADTPR